MKAETIKAIALKLVERNVQDTRDKSVYPCGIDFELIIVWQCWILGYMKFLITSDLPDGKYYEVTYNAEMGEFYLDVYVRVHNECSNSDEWEYIEHTDESTFVRGALGNED